MPECSQALFGPSETADNVVAFICLERYFKQKLSLLAFLTKLIQQCVTLYECFYRRMWAGAPALLGENNISAPWGQITGLVIIVDSLQRRCQTNRGYGQLKGSSTCLRRSRIVADAYHLSKESAEFFIWLGKLACLQDYSVTRDVHAKRSQDTLSR